MPIYDYDGSVSREISKVYDFDGAALHQIGKVYDYDGTTNREIYSAEMVLVGDGAVASEITVAANWDNAGRVQSRTISASEIYFCGGGNGTYNGAIKCSVPLPRGYSDLEILIAQNACYMGDASVKLGTTYGGNDAFDKHSMTGTFHVALDPNTDYYLTLAAGNAYSPDGVVQVTKLKLT